MRGAVPLYAHMGTELCVHMLDIAPLVTPLEPQRKHPPNHRLPPSLLWRPLVLAAA